MVKIKKRIAWKDLQVGDMFIDGSQVIDIKEWEESKCYKLTSINGDTLVCAYTHLLKAIIRDKSLNGAVINNTKGLFPLSEQVRRESDILQDIWISTEDIFNCFNDPNLDVFLLDNKDNEYPLGKIELFRDGEPLKCRCITTTYGFYTTGDFVNHNCGSGQVSSQINASHIIMTTLDGFKTSPIIQKACKAETTQEMREIIFHGLKDLYHDAGIKEDDFNIQMIARKLTSYKRGKNGIEPIQPGEKADIVSMISLGNKNNIFKKAELSAGYNVLTKPTKQTLKKDAANDILR